MSRSSIRDSLSNLGSLHTGITLRLFKVSIKRHPSKPKAGRLTLAARHGIAGGLRPMTFLDVAQRSTADPLVMKMIHACAIHELRIQ
jgi:hypothetical protein